MPIKILIVDDDPWILRMVSTVLAKRGFLPEVAADGQEALEKALAAPPDLVITDVMMPRMDGWSLIRHLRARAETALVPVIFLTALGGDDDRIQGFRLGADDYLPKPFRFEELDLRVGSVLRKRQEVDRAADEVRRAVPAAASTAGGAGSDPAGAAGANAGGEAPAAIRGSLRQLGLPALLVMLEMERKSGVLEVAREGATGQLLARDGRIVAACIEPAQVRGVEAVFRLLRWSDGTFDFRAREVEVEDEIGSSITHLLMEGARLADEEQR